MHESTYALPSSSSSATVGVVLLNWNAGEFTIPCIESLLSGQIKPDRIVVVDNASVDESPDRIEAAFPGVILIRNRVNEGFAGANNKGISFLLGEGMDYIWVLNNDTFVREDCLACLLEAAQRHPEAACFSAKIFYENPSDRVWYAGSFRHPLLLVPKHLQEARPENRTNDGLFDVDFVSGCCMFIPGRVLRKQGGFCTDYCAYSEDNDWCWRVQKVGLKLLYVPGAVLWHRVSASVRKNTARKKETGISARAYFLMIRNNLWTIRRNAENVPGKALALAMNGGLAFKIMALCAMQGYWYKIGPIWKGASQGLFKALPKI